MTQLHYEVIYRNGDRKANKFADFWRTEEGRFVFKYIDGSKYEFPGFSLSQQQHESDVLWEQIAIRVPNVVRDAYPSKPVEELLKETSGKIITDNFELVFAG
jgi:hypothetical protein